MTREIERKYRIGDQVALQQRLTAAGARLHRHVLQVSRIFDDTRGGMRAAGQALRVRSARSLKGDDEELAQLTFKGPREPGTTKIREELELRVGDSELMATVLERLGYREVVRYETRRQSWYLKRCEVSLDELPRLGWFAEVEGPSVAAVKEVAAALGLPDEQLEQSSYVTLTEQQGEADGPLRRLAFTDVARRTP